MPILLTDSRDFPAVNVAADLAHGPPLARALPGGHAMIRTPTTPTKPDLTQAAEDWRPLLELLSARDAASV